MSELPRPGAARTRCALALGSNLGDRAAHLQRAVDALAAHPRIEVTAVSPWIETEPVGGPPGQGAYLNGALLLETDLAPERLLELLLAIELQEGRDRTQAVRDAPRTLDLDLLLYGARSIDSERLCVPHPRLEERLFVLEPLARIAPELRLPRSGRTVRERLAEFGRPLTQGAGGGAS